MIKTEWELVMYLMAAFAVSVERTSGDRTMFYVETVTRREMLLTKAEAQQYANEHPDEKLYHADDEVRIPAVSKNSQERPRIKPWKKG